MAKIIPRIVSRKNVCISSRKNTRRILRGLFTFKQISNYCDGYRCTESSNFQVFCLCQIYKTRKLVVLCHIFKITVINLLSEYKFLKFEYSTAYSLNPIYDFRIFDHKTLIQTRLHLNKRLSICIYNNSKLYTCIHKCNS